MASTFLWAAFQTLGITSDTALQELEKPAKPFPLFQLPAELRLHIYEAALILPCPIYASPYAHPKNPPQHHALLRTCRQVQREASKIYFSRNTFHFGNGLWDPEDALAWLGRIGRANLKLVRWFSVDLEAAGMRRQGKFFERLQNRATGLSVLTIWLAEIQVRDNSGVMQGVEPDGAVRMDLRVICPSDETLEKIASFSHLDRVVLLCLKPSKIKVPHIVPLNLMGKFAVNGHASEVESLVDLKLFEENCKPDKSMLIPPRDGLSFH